MSNNSFKFENNLELLDSFDASFRELPVDCPISNRNKDSATVNIGNERGNEEHEKDQIVADILNNSLVPLNFPNRRTFVKSTSLSTIAEEKTLQNYSLSVNELKKSEAPLNGRLMIEKLLDDFQDKNVFIHEIMQVFEPSSKSGNFYRNVPIRFSSPIRQIKLDSSQTSLNSLSTGSTYLASPNSATAFSPTSFRSQKNLNDLLVSNLIGKPPVEYADSNKSSNWLGNLIAAKKMRLVKRLKNRIETKTGHKILNTKPTTSLVCRKQSKAEKCSSNKHAADSTVKRNLFTITKEENNNQQSYEHLFEAALTTHEDVKSYLQTQHELERSNSINNHSFILANTDVEPAYF